jgi:NCS1 family nucleobase:cation symporter-1
MSSFGIIVTPVIGIIVSDFTFVRKNRLRINHLFTTEKSSGFYYTGGVNWRAIFVFIIAVTPGLPGMAAATNPDIVLTTSIINYYYGSIIFSFFFPLVLYYIIAVWIFPIEDAGITEGEDVFNAFTDGECLKLNLIPFNGVHEEVIVLEEIIHDDKKLKKDTSGSSSSKGL